MDVIGRTSLFCDGGVARANLCAVSVYQCRKLKSMLTTAINSYSIVASSLV